MDSHRVILHFYYIIIRFFFYYYYKHYYVKLQLDSVGQAGTFPRGQISSDDLFAKLFTNTVSLRYTYIY